MNQTYCVGSTLQVNPCRLAAFALSLWLFSSPRRIGTYELLRYLNLSGQLSRRNLSVHFRRYQVELAEDMEAFRNILMTLQMQMPLDNEPDLYALWKYLYTHSLGCIGILKEWLTRALADGSEEGALTLTETHLQRRALSVAQCKRILQEMKEGEKALQEAPEDCDDLYRAIFGSNAPTNSPAEAIAKPNRPHGKVGKRRPQRDPIEAQQNVG